MLGLAARLGEALQGFPEELRAIRRRQLRFATAPLPSLRGSSWLPQLLEQWRSPRRILSLETTTGTTVQSPGCILVANVSADARAWTCTMSLGSQST